MGSILASASPFSNAKLATQTRLAASPIREVIVRPDMFQEVWLTPLVSFNWPDRKFTIFGKGDAAHRYVAVDVVAARVMKWALSDDPPRMVEFGGPEALTRNQAVDVFEQARPMHLTIAQPCLDDSNGLTDLTAGQAPGSERTGWVLA